MPDAPVLSLIVPTRERARTLSATLATTLDQRSSDYEVIVSDNASQDDTRAVVAAIDDPRVRYVNTGQRLSMCGNYEFALGQATGEYVLIIGDDDGIVPGALDSLLSRLRTSNSPVVHTWPLHIYDWPGEGRSAQVAYLAPTLAEHAFSLKERARRVVELGGWKYYELPSPYHSAVPRRILDAIRERTGRVFHSTQPDVFTAMAIPAFADHAINIGSTVSFNGRSPKSNGAGFVQRSAFGNIERFIAEYGDYDFHPTLYRGAPAAANMIPDAVLVARDLFPELYASTQFNYSAMWAYVCRLRFAAHRDVVATRHAIRSAHPLNIAAFMGYAVLHTAGAMRRRLLNATDRHKAALGAAPADVASFARMLAASGVT